MANNDNARGLSLARSQGASAHTGGVNRYYVPDTDATANYVGGLVKLAGSADAEGVPSVTGNISPGDTVVGVVVATEAITQDSTTYRAASTERYVLVADDPNELFEIQEDSFGGALTADSVGLNASVTGATDGSTFTGRSTMELDSDTADTTATLDLSIHRLVRRGDNEIGEFAKWLVRLNNHQYKDQTTGV